MVLVCQASTREWTWRKCRKKGKEISLKCQNITDIWTGGVWVDFDDQATSCYWQTEKSKSVSGKGDLGLRSLKDGKVPTKWEVEGDPETKWRNWNKKTGLEKWKTGRWELAKPARKQVVEIDSGTRRRDCDHVCIIRELNRTGSRESLGMAKHPDQSRKLVASHSQKFRMGEGDWSCK